MAGDTVLGIVTAILSGVLMSVQGVFNEGVTKQTSLWLSAAFVQATALAFCIGAWLLTGREPVSGLLHVEPRYLLLGGVFGALITVTVVKSMAALGPAQAVLVIVLSQLAAAYLIELVGLFGVEKTAFAWRKAVGLLVAVGGVILFQWQKK